MSSTSSSDCDNCDYCKCGYSLDNDHNCCNSNCKSQLVSSSRHFPFFSTMGHPLIYYAEVQQPLNRRPRDRPRKENKNCFVKAFKWYTQERGSPKNECVPKCGFANWLDDKYIQYLRESRLCQAYELTAQETETTEPCAPCPTPYEPCSTKRFARMRSPWKKRRRPCKDSGDMFEKCANQSCEYILQPKDLTRAASDCYPTPTSGCKSTATVVSSNVPGTLKCSGRSRSLSSVRCEKSAPIHIDTIPCTVQEGIKPQPPPKPPCERREQIQQVPSKSRSVDVSCQCPEEKVIPVDAQTQYESIRYVTPNSTEARTLCFCILEDEFPHAAPVKICSRNLSIPEVKPTTVPSTQNYAPKKQKKVQKNASVQSQCPEERIVTVYTQCQYENEPSMCECRNIASCRENHHNEIQEMNPKMIRCQSFTNVAVNDKVIHESRVKETPTVSKFTCSLTCVANDAVQTSDHSICLERGGAAYPLYMKIICADKLNENPYK